jgi:hypothetical protein
MGLGPTHNYQERWWRELQLAASASADGLRCRKSLNGDSTVPMGLSASRLPGRDHTHSPDGRSRHSGVIFSRAVSV